MTASDLQENIAKLNNGITFMIKHSQKIFKVSVPGGKWFLSSSWSDLEMLGGGGDPVVC